MNIQKTWDDEKLLKAATGLTKMEAAELLVDFSTEMAARNQSTNTTQSYPGGRPAKLDDRGLFMMLMLFYRHYPTIDLLAVMFELNSSNVKRWIDRCEDLLKAVLAKKNLSHLIAPDPERTSKKPLSDNEKFISMALNNLFADREIQ